MGRSADYTIQGFLYQFNLTLSELLIAKDDALISIEGIVEDIEVVDSGGMKAIQCKYHEAQSKYTPSIIYDPLLQMMGHFKSNSALNARYHLFAHFPNTTQIAVSIADLNAALSSKDKSLTKLVANAQGVDLNAFLSVFSISVTLKYDDLIARNINDLQCAGFAKGEVETLFYPNAIQIIADLSVKHNPKMREISKKDFLEKLRQIRTTAVSHWTLALKTRQKILDARRKQIKLGLNNNSRLRHLIVFPKFLANFNDQIVMFIQCFVQKYHFKPAHTQTPLVAIDIPLELFNELAERLVDKGVTLNHGRPFMKFSEDNFFRKPLVQKGVKEFVVRIIRWEDYKNLKSEIKPDDLIVIGNGDLGGLDTTDVNVEILATENFNELKYILGMTDGY